jgi:hypothetical protein
LYGRAGRLTAENGGFRPGQSVAFDPGLRARTAAALLAWAAAVEALLCVCLLAQELSFRIPKPPCIPLNDTDANGVLDWEDCQRDWDLWHGWPTWFDVEDSYNRDNMAGITGQLHLKGQRGQAINWCKEVSFVFQLAWTASDCFYFCISLDLLLNLVVLG